MKFKHYALFVGLIMGLTSCDDDPVAATEYFQMSERTTYDIRLSGRFADTLYFKNDTLQQWEYVTGTEVLTGDLYVFTLDDENKFSGYFRWTRAQRSYDRRVIRQLFTQWDTADNTVNQLTLQIDSFRPVGGRLRTHSITLKNDTLDLLMNAGNLPFEIENQTTSTLQGFAGYSTRSTVIEGHPDSTDFSYYRRFWNLRDLLIQD
ncbi:hypothetical protein [Phaeocystidibacter luteus]|uniref:Uncharacterized protein n=1 Tax=Phaeocystidibacter luteus TaxID=911197 RepID=A0A6N6RJ26_9FLAO|nr:hypothetical protein [Phaeocystidibacter luteus]KAB2810388.1 hypothetical protein F8C67_07310 [Phaeocystidibacter luteus]